MASRNAIASVGQSILNVLHSACPRTEFPDADFQLFQATNFQQGMPQGISLYLYRIVPANNIRNVPPRVVGNRRFRPPVPVDLHFLLTAWSPDAYAQLRLLGWAIRELENSPTLHASVLNQPPSDFDVFAATESVDMIMETLSIQDMLNIWEMGKPNMRPSVSYVVRMVRLDSEIEMTTAAPVQVRDYEYAQVLR